MMLIAIVWLSLVGTATSWSFKPNMKLSGYVLVDNNFTYITQNLPVEIDFDGKVQLMDSWYVKDVVSTHKASLRFEPPSLEFAHKLVGHPYTKKFTIINTSQNKTLKINKIVCSPSSNFKINQFGSVLMPPGANSTFEILFVGIDYVIKTKYYYIYTSRGIVKYDVAGVCIENPYRLSSLTSIRLPLNSTFSHSIVLRNPFPTNLLVTEAILHDGDYVHHSLPSYNVEAPLDAWTLRPYETKEISRLHFYTYEPWNLSTIHSLKLGTGKILYVPVEIEVTSKPGLYVPFNRLDFGSGGYYDPPAVKPLHICSSVKKPISIVDIYCQPEDHGCEVYDFKPIIIAAYSCLVHPAAKIRYNWNLMLPGNVSSNELIVQNDYEDFKVGYSARVVDGGFTYNKELSQYKTGSQNFSKSARAFVFTNRYAEYVGIMNAELTNEAENYFRLRHIIPITMKPFQEKQLFILYPKRGAKLNGVTMDASVLLETNVTNIRVPIRIYNGYLKKVSKVGEDLHLGLFGMETHVVSHFAVVNPNPEPTNITAFGSKNSFITVDFIDCRPGDDRTFYFRQFANKTTTVPSYGFKLPPNNYASFRITLYTGKERGDISSMIWVQTENERLEFSVHLTVEKGHIEMYSDPLVLNNCFPGANCVTYFSLVSHFPYIMDVVNVTCVLPSPQEKFVYQSIIDKIIPHSSGPIGKLYWEPTLGPTHTMALGYLGLQNNKTGRDRWLGTVERLNITRDFDYTTMGWMYSRYKEQFKDPYDLLVRLDTNYVKNYMFKVRSYLTWPSLVSTHVIRFREVAVHDIVYQNITVFNRMHSEYLTIQAIMSENYQQEVPEVVKTSILEFLSNKNIPRRKSTDFFLVTDIPSKYRQYSLMGTKRMFTNDKDSLIFVIPPNCNVTLRIGFTPTNVDPGSSILYLRNDLSILDWVVLTGNASYPRLAVDGFENGAAITMNITEQALQKYVYEPDTQVKLTMDFIVLRNIGRVRIKVLNVLINNVPCVSSGFGIVGCLDEIPFYLEPDAARQLTITFMPDFTKTRVITSLEVVTDPPSYPPDLRFVLVAEIDERLHQWRADMELPTIFDYLQIFVLIIFAFVVVISTVSIQPIFFGELNNETALEHQRLMSTVRTPQYAVSVMDMIFAKSTLTHKHDTPSMCRAAKIDMRLAAPPLQPKPIRKAVSTHTQTKRVHEPAELVVDEKVNQRAYDETSNKKQSDTNQTNNTIENHADEKPRKGRKGDYEEVCYKSNWLKKRQLRKEEKLQERLNMQNPAKGTLKSLKKTAKSLEEQCSEGVLLGRTLRSRNKSMSEDPAERLVTVMTSIVGAKTAKDPNRKLFNSKSTPSTSSPVPEPVSPTLSEEITDVENSAPSKWNNFRQKNKKYVDVVKKPSQERLETPSPVRPESANRQSESRPSNSPVIVQSELRESNAANTKKERADVPEGMSVRAMKRLAKQREMEELEKLTQGITKALNTHDVITPKPRIHSEQIVNHDEKIPVSGNFDKAVKRQVQTRLDTPEERSSSSSSTDSISYNSSPISNPSPNTVLGNNILWESWSNNQILNNIVPQDHSSFPFPPHYQASNFFEWQVKNKNQKLNKREPDETICTNFSGQFCSNSVTNQSTQTQKTIKRQHSLDGSNTVCNGWSDANLENSASCMSNGWSDGNLENSEASIWGPPSIMPTWTPAELSEDKKPDVTSSVPISRLLRFEKPKTVTEADFPKLGAISSIWSSTTKSLWGQQQKKDN